MTRDYITLGPTPADEECEQLGDNYNHSKARLECQIYREQLQRQFQSQSDARDNTVALVIRGFDHDFGRYLEVVADYDSENEADVELALKIEGELPGNWDADSLARLEELGLTEKA